LESAQKGNAGLTMADARSAPEEVIAALRAELAAAQAELQDFSYTVSHDLRADLRHILAFAEVVQEDAGPQLDAEARSHLATITGAAKHMGVLMDGLMAYSRLGTVALHVESVPLLPLVQRICDALLPATPPRTVQWRIADDLPAVRADGTLLAQALTHVLSNADKFTATRALAVIEVAYADGALFVRDNGVGFNPAMQTQLFRVFGRLHSTREFDGVGMGLALTRKIVGRLGGQVSAEGALDSGCCVRITLPV
jgi:light-regulated signal transduction histidine kinase (bacteriophytochrome)